MKKFIIGFAAVLMIFAAAGVYAASNLVAYNVESQKYHRLDCKWAIKCTKSCIIIYKEDAISRGGVPCKVCGGG